MKQTATDTTVYVRDASGNVMSVYTKTAGGNLLQTETHLYGSSRLGMATQHLAPDTTILLSSIFGSAIKSTFTRGEKIFELSNHLGNVLATISDRRIQVSAGGQNVDSYSADIVTANDYYPFGMSMPGRKFQAGSNYRYGFNGKENDKDISEGAQDYGMRIYDTRAGRFFTVDPIAKKYPELTPYQFASNSPISGIDLDGLEYYFCSDGVYLGHRTADGQGKPLPLSVSNSVRVAEDVIDTKELTIWSGVTDLKTDINTFLHLSAFGYNENTKNANSQLATENIIINRSKAGKKTLEKVMGGMAGGTIGSTHEKRMESKWFKPYAAFMNTDMYARNNAVNMKTAIKGAISAISGNDITNDAVYEKGRDFFTSKVRPNGTNWPDYIDFRDNGMKWDVNGLLHGDYNSTTIPDHLGDVSKDYRYIGTASYGGNAYLKDNPDYNYKPAKATRIHLKTPKK